MHVYLLVSPLVEVMTACVGWILEHAKRSLLVEDRVSHREHS